MNRKWIGAHVSAAGGVACAVERAADLKANAFALFVKNQRQWQAPSLSSEAIRAFKTACLRHHFKPEQILPHGSYLINIGHSETEPRMKSTQALIDELQRCADLGLTALNIHPGAHLGSDLTSCLKHIAQSLNQAMLAVPSVRIVLENSAGQGSQVGYCFEHLAGILGQVDRLERIGICIDTCHAFSAGYDLRTEAGCDRTFEAFSKQLGFHYLKGLHLNDSKTEYGRRVDRHHSLGRGYLGQIPFTYIMKDPRFNEIPLILETIDSELWPEEIAWLRRQIDLV